MYYLSFLLVISSMGYSQKDTESTPADYTQFVNLMIGTSKMGHTFPGVTAPFGMVQLSPQTNFEVMFKDDGIYNAKAYEYCAGYQHKASTIICLCTFRF